MFTSHPDSCETNWKIEIIYNDYIMRILSILAAVCMIPPLYYYLKAYIKKELKASKRLFVAGMVFYSSIFTCFIVLAVGYVEYCHNSRLHLIFSDISSYLYLFQNGMLLAFLFLRLHSIFNTSDFPLSRWTIGLFITCDTCFICLGTLGIILKYSTTHFVDIGTFLFGLATPVYVISVIWLNAIFIYKLIKVNEAAQKNVSDDSKMVNIITKISVLCCVSTSNIIVNFIFYILLNRFNSPHIVFGSGLALIADLYTNFLSILLSYKYFHSWYIRICGCCDAQCHKCWKKYIEYKVDEIHLKDIISSSKD